MLTEKDYCDYETCVALKELGYVGTGEECYHFGAYFNNGEDIFYDDVNNNEIALDEYLRVPLFLAQKWLRKEKQINVGTDWDDDENHWYSYIKKIGFPDWSGTSVSHSCYSSYEEALSEGIKEAVKNLKEDANIQR